MTAATFLSESFLPGEVLEISLDATAVLVPPPILDFLGLFVSTATSSAAFLATIFLTAGVIRVVTFPVSLAPVVALAVVYDEIPPAAILSYKEASMGSSLRSSVTAVVFLPPATGVV